MRDKAGGRTWNKGRLWVGPLGVDLKHLPCNSERNCSSAEHLGLRAFHAPGVVQRHQTCWKEVSIFQATGPSEIQPRAFTASDCTMWVFPRTRKPATSDCLRGSPGPASVLTRPACPQLQKRCLDCFLVYLPVFER